MLIFQMSISRNGRVPAESTAFEIYVNCTGVKSGNVTFETNLIFHIQSQQTSEKVSIKIKRLKKCEKSNSLYLCIFSTFKF